MANDQNNPSTAQRAQQRSWQDQQERGESPAQRAPGSTERDGGLSNTPGRDTDGEPTKDYTQASKEPEDNSGCGCSGEEDSDMGAPDADQARDETATGDRSLSEE